MRQEGSYNNNVMVGSVDGGSTVNINQHRRDEPFEERFIEYGRDGNEGGEHYTRRDVFTRAAVAAGSAALGALAVFADLLSVFGYFGVGKLLATALVLLASFVPLAIYARFVALLLLPRSEQTDHFTFGRFAHKGEDGGYELYELSAPCGYPRCRGVVKPISAPPREKLEHSLVGTCSVGKRQHSYTFDYNRVGRPRQFDWRPAERNP